MTPESLRLLAHIFAREPDAELAEAVRASLPGFEDWTAEPFEESAVAYATTFLLPRGVSLLAGAYGFTVPGGVTSLEVALPPPVPTLPHDHVSQLLFIAAALDPDDVPTFLEATLSPWVGKLNDACQRAPAVYAAAATFIRAACP